MSRWVGPDTRAVFFDAVGTLLFPWPAAPVVYAGVALRYGLDLSPAVVGDRFRAAFRAEEEADRAAGWVTSEGRELARWWRIVTHTLAGVSDPKACFHELFQHFSKPAAWVVNQDAEAIFSRLRERGLVLGIASNYDARLRSVVAGHDTFAPLADRLVISAAVGHRKPSWRFFDEVARVARCEPSAVLLVGDDPENDYEGATAAGLQAVLLDPDGRHPSIERRISALRELLGQAVPGE
jgi:putative hydrolase of the HAD superfamily